MQLFQLTEICLQFKFKDKLHTSPQRSSCCYLEQLNQLSRGAKTIEYMHIVDDNAGSYYDQHAYITHRIANMVVRDSVHQRICNSFR